jgi:hypothetical protein
MSSPNAKQLLFSIKEFMPFLNRIEAAFCPFDPNSTSIRTFIAQLNVPIMRQVNPNCEIKVDILSPSYGSQQNIVSPVKITGESDPIFPKAKLYMKLKNGDRIDFNLNESTTLQLLIQQLHDVLGSSVLQQRQVAEKENQEKIGTSKRSTKSSKGKSTSTTAKFPGKKK